MVAILDTLASRASYSAAQAIEFMRSFYYAGREAKDVNEVVPIYHDIVELVALGNGARIGTLYRQQTHGDVVVDQLVLHQGIVPEIHLADSLGCEIVWDDTAGCWNPRVDAWGTSSIARVFIAGDGAGIAGANAAAHRGALAALAAATTLGRMDRSKRDAAAIVHRQLAVRLARAKALNAAGVLARDAGDFVEARPLQAESVALFETLGDTERLANARQNLGQVLFRLGDREGARMHLEASLEQLRRFDDKAQARSASLFACLGALGQLAMLPSSSADRFAVTRTPDDE